MQEQSMKQSELELISRIQVEVSTTQSGWSSRHKQIRGRDAHRVYQTKQKPKEHNRKVLNINRAAARRFVAAKKASTTKTLRYMGFGPKIEVAQHSEIQVCDLVRLIPIAADGI